MVSMPAVELSKPMPGSAKQKRVSHTGALSGLMIYG